MMTVHEFYRRMNAQKASGRASAFRVENATSRIWPARPNAFAGRCHVLTSLSPNPARLSRQLRCLQSWVDYGLPVIVVNTREELSGMFLPPGVESVASEDLTTIYKRPVQRINALLNIGIETGLPFYILNADIEINGHTSTLFQSLEAKDKLTIGVRWNYDAATEPTAEQWGLDCFGLTPKMAETLPQMPLGIGRPFWDYWVPLHFKQRGVRFHWITTPFFFHETHPVQWSNDEWVLGCQTVLDQYGVAMWTTSEAFRTSLNNWR